MEFALGTIRQDESPLNMAFFSESNIAAIQVALQKTIYEQTKRIIDRQSLDDLFAIMRGVFITTSTNPETYIDDQVQYLNHSVLAAIIPQVMFGIRAREKYLKDIGGPAEPMDRGMYVSNKGMISSTLPIGI